MGTRNLTMVIVDRETKVAQYGQWDGYPSGQGATALDFLLNTDISKFKQKVKTSKFIDENKQKEINDFLKSIGCENGWMNGDQSDMYQSKYPLHTRDNGAGVLQKIMETEGEIWLTDSSDFATDSLFCEWGYVIDLDKGTFEVYEGFQGKPLGKTQRFKHLEKEGSDYYPIRMIKKYDLDNLPTMEQFLNDFKNK